MSLFACMFVVLVKFRLYELKAYRLVSNAELYISSWIGKSYSRELPQLVDDIGSEEIPDHLNSLMKSKATESYLGLIFLLFNFRVLWLSAWLRQPVLL